MKKPLRVIALFLCATLSVGLLWNSNASPADPQAALSASPSEQEIKAARIFPEPLLPVGHKPSAKENRELATALQAYRQRAIADDFSALEQFIARHPDSAWRAALEFNLAVEYYNTGWYSKALDAWRKTWPLLKDKTDPGARSLADRAAGELAYMYGRLGRMTELAALLREVEGRVFIGSATEKISGARQGLWTMQHRPEIAFRCGPFALEQILLSQKSTNAGSFILHDAASTTNGCSLNEVVGLSRRIGMNYQMAFRQPGAALLMPAVVNWKLGHYAALIKEEGGLYLLQDPTFGNDAWVSRRVLEEESSGYFIVPPGTLPSGWRSVSAEEGGKVFGKGTTSDADQDSTTCHDWLACGLRNLFQWATDLGGKSPEPRNLQGSGGGGIRGMAVADVHLMVVSLNLRDAPVGYAPPVGPPVWFIANYNQREAGQPAIFTYANLGPKWTFNWLAYINDNPSATNADVKFYTDGGGALPFSGFNTNTQTYAPQVKTQALLKRTSTNSYELLYGNGAKLIFAKPGSVGGTSRRVFLTQVLDPAGNAVQINFDSSLRVTNVVDAIGQVTTFSYTNATDPLRITQVTDPFGRTANFSYDTGNRLAQITDAAGLTSQFTYNGGDFIQALTTLYGTTSFEKGESGRTRWLVTTHPNGEKERVEYNETAVTGVPDADPGGTIPAGMVVYNGYLIYRNSFYWDRKAYAEAPLDYSKARLVHWLHLGGLCSGVPESTRAPFENRVWFRYDGQSASVNYGTSDQPTQIGRVLDDGNTQLTQLRYDAVGHATNSVDPAGRSLTLIYSTNLVDLLEFRQTTGNNNELIFKFQNNSQHLPVAVWDSAGQLTTNIYNARGQLISTTNPKGETRTLTYDSNGYLIAADGPLPGASDAIAFTYDAAGRVRTVTGTDSYTLVYSYDNLDRLTNVAYPDGTFAAFTYDKLDVVKTRDRLGRETLYTYDALRQLTSIQDPLSRITRLEYCDCGQLSALVDPLGRRTQWDYDIRGRVTAKTFADGSQTQFSYENTTSRLKSVRDEQGQTKIFEYDIADNVTRVSTAVGLHPAPSIKFTYDPNYNRLLARQDGLGTTTYSYNPVGTPGALQRASVDGPWDNDTVTYHYDELGRVTSRAINGVAQSMNYDASGRITNVVNALGGFNYSYDGATARLLDELLPGGQSVHFDYLNTLGDRRLQAITHRQPDTSVISRFTYSYNSVANITNLLQESSAATNNWSIADDAADQLNSVLIQDGANSTAYAYGYDPAGNRSLVQSNAASLNFYYNSLNEPVSATDATLTNTTYEWDADHRLIAVNRGTNRSEFYYDGLYRCARIVEKQNGVTVNERRFVWCGLELCEERDATGATVQKRFFNQGVQLVGGPAAGNYFYTRDHLGSVRELLDATGTIRARFDYDPWGGRTKLSGDLDADFGFTGHFYHPTTGLVLAPMRAYSPRLGRWLSRDPLGEAGAVNLYVYASNDPINRRDPLGFCDDPGWLSRTWEGLGNAFGNAWDKTYTWYATSPVYLPVLENKIENWYEQHEPELEHAILSGLETANALVTKEAPMLPTATAAVSVIAQNPKEFVQGVTAVTTYSSSLQEAINLSNQDLNNQPIAPQKTLQIYNQTQNILNK